MSPPRKAVIFVNPTARGVGGRFDGARALRYLHARGVEATIEEPESGEDSTARARAAAERGIDMVFVVGGDGSLRAAARGLAGTTTAAAPVPAGTVNVFAREAGIPRGVRKAFDAHLDGQVCPVDLGLTSSGERFLLMASIGWDAAIAASTSLRLKRRFGDKAYILEALRRIPFLRTSPARWSAGDEHHDRRLAMMVVSNTRLYGGRVAFSPRAVANDGLLDLCALCPGGPMDAFRLALKLARSRLVGDTAVVNARATRVSVETAGLAVQLDGDPIGHTPMEFSVEPGALLVSLPAGPRPAILPTEPLHGL